MAVKPFPLTDENGQINATTRPGHRIVNKLAFHSDAPNGFHQIGIFDINTRQISWLTEGEANCRAPAWSKDGTQLTYIRAQGTSDKVIVHALNGAAQEFPGRNRRALQAAFHPGRITDRLCLQ